VSYLVHHLLRTSAKKDPSKEALLHKGESLTYSQIEERTDLFARGLVQAGLRRGERVGIFLEKSINEALSIFAVLKAGGVFVPINNLLFPDQVRHIINDCQMKAIITPGGKLKEIRDGLPNTPSIEFIVSADGGPGKIQIPNLFYMDDFARMGAGEAPKDVCISQDLAAILYTSGSTGRPKGVMLSHANLLAGSQIVSDYLGITWDERILSILPFSFDYGLNQLLTAFQHGGTIVLLNFRFPNEIIQALLTGRITGLAGVPPLWSLIAQPSSSLHKKQFPHLRYITNSGGTMPLTVLDSLRKALPKTKVFLMYGLTEAFRSCYLPPEELDKRPTSFGKAIPDTEIFLVNGEGELCKPGEVGELVHRGPTVSLGYWGLPEATARVLRPNPLLPPELRTTERVCYSGDLVKADEEGYFYFVTRGDATIKSSGYRISPNEVEQVLYQSGRLREAAVIGIPDDVLGQAIKAFVVPRDGERLEAADILSYCASKMPRYMVPRFMEILDELPKTSSGKIDYPALRRLESPA